MTTFETIAALYSQRGGEVYFGEQISMLEHGLQAAYFAREEGAPPAFIAANLALAESRLAWPVRMIRTVSGANLRLLPRNRAPSIPGIRMSEMTAANAPPRRIS